MMKRLKILSFILLAASLFSCHKGPVCDCFDAAGAPTSENRSDVLPYFNQINAGDDINVFLSMGNTEQVIIEGGSNLVHNISATVSNQVLTLKNNNNCNWLRSYRKSIINVYITMPQVSYITNSGYGTITGLDSIITDTLNVRTTNAGDINLTVRTKQFYGHFFGSGDITLNGKTNNLACTYFAGTGFLYADNFTSGYCFVANLSTGDCHVNCTGLLQAEVKSRGNIYYSGSPTQVQASIVGSGAVIRE